MDVFAFREQLVAEYERFSRSFTAIRSKDVREHVDRVYADGYFWPDPLIQLNPNFVPGASVDELVSQGTLDPECARVFRVKKPDDSGGRPLQLYQHQCDAIEAARRRESYVVTTGTGSGKSLAYFIPIVDHVLRRKRVERGGNRITAIVVYPMNALCNSQMEELEKFLRIGYGEGQSPVTFARYTGQESHDEREEIAKNPPDILMTNFVMLELIMTRFIETDKAVRKHARGLEFLVLDELHTYRGRQGADAAMLVRRVRERFNENLLCIGTSATMASDGSADDRNATVADVATRLFGVAVRPGNVVTETLQRVTNPGNPPGTGPPSSDGSELRNAIQAGVPQNPTHEELSVHPVAAWVERNLGLDREDGKLVRIARPLSVKEAAARLADDSGIDAEECGGYLADFLLAAYQCRDASGRSFFAFRLHQFISGAWNVFATMEAPGERYVTLEGQQYKPSDRERPLFPLCFCRECGQEYVPIWARTSPGQTVSVEPRELFERSSDDEDVRFGYIMPDDRGEFDDEDLEGQYPAEWLIFQEGGARLKPHFRKYRPKKVRVSTVGELDGAGGEGLRAWLVPGPFRFCLNPECTASYGGNVRSEVSKLSGLSGEGRSSASTVLALSAMKYLADTDLDDRTKKLLAFIDNRQDASLQAGHFNDFVQILMLRGALLTAIKSHRSQSLTDDVLAQSVLDHLGLEPADYSANPDAKGQKAVYARETLRDVVGYRLYFDLQRGWRINNPNLEQLGLLQIEYRGLEECCRDEEEWQARHPLLGSATPEQRLAIVRELLDVMRRALCIKTIYLNLSFQERLRNRSYTNLKEPWGLSEDERPYASGYMVPRPRPRNLRDRELIKYVSYCSVFGRSLKSRAKWGVDNPRYPAKFDEAVYNTVIDDILNVLTTYGYVEPTELTGNRTGYRVDSSALMWQRESADGLAAGGRSRGNGTPGPASDTQPTPTSTTEHNTANVFFRTLYANVADLLAGNDRFLHAMEAREHTAQVDSETREEREERFRKGAGPNGLPVLFCSPTMELGVDIAMLNTVYMRNVPPTPANYAQRSGRAGRSGQPALVIAYCAARSPHDQYFFADPARMVAGSVTPPAIDLANEDLIRSHLQAVWLAETGVMLGSSVPQVLDMQEGRGLPLHPDIASQLDRRICRARAEERARRILATLAQDLSRESAPWYTETWTDNALNTAFRRFDKAFNRWRSLFRATESQMKSARKVMDNAATSPSERQEAKNRHDEAFKQRGLLLGTGSYGSDFYTYRYLAAEGFLPGYNFPRLPLMAYIPGRRDKIGRDSFLRRPRFLGLTEFGPQSIIYHEGSTYRVRRAIITIDDEQAVTTSAKLPVRAARICPSCGYGHFRDQRDFERCVSCDTRMDGGRTISNLYRIEQVSTRRATRITSDEEERQRQGYEMITTLRYSEENGSPRVQSVILEEGGQPLLELRYGPAATLWRINLGWRRREHKSVYGFSIDARTGEWTKDSQAPTDAEDDRVREGKTVQRITPFVEDTRNAVMLRPRVKLSDAAMVSLQYALKRGIEQEFQLEESELAAEPLPGRDERNNILIYEASEGGAGVLTRLASDPGTVRRIARAALQTCHFEPTSGEWTDEHNLVDQRSECEAGCYRCLLSYTNQPDHKEIDRQNSDMLGFLCRLTRVRGKGKDGGTGTQNGLPRHLAELLRACTSSLEEAWLHYLFDGGYRLPDRAQRYLEDYATRPDFVYRESQTLVYIDGPTHQLAVRESKDREIERHLTAAGFTVIRFTYDKRSWDGIVEEYAWVFGTGNGRLAGVDGGSSRRRPATSVRATGEVP